MSLYDRVVAPTLSEGVAKWVRRQRSKKIGDSGYNKAGFRARFGQAAGEHRKMFGKTPGGHHSPGAWQRK